MVNFKKMQKKFFVHRQFKLQQDAVGAFTWASLY